MLRVLLAGVRVMEVRVGLEELTVMAAVVLRPLALAVRVADPAATAVTTPAEFTVATLGRLVVQVTLES
jgi:hypothetical protein